MDVDCLKRVTLDQIMDAHSELFTTIFNPIALFAPSVEVGNC